MKNAIEIPTAELKMALTGLGKVVNKRAALPYLQSIKIARDNLGIVSLQGTDLDSWATYKLTVAQEGAPTEFLVPMEALNKTAKTAKDRIVLYPQNATTVTIQTFVGTTTVEQQVETVETKEWPIAPQIPPRSLFLNEHFRDTLKEAFECASQDETRYVLNSVFMDVQDPNAHYLVSTNGRILFSANSFNFDLKDSLIIPMRKFLGWAGWWPQGEARLAVKPTIQGKDGEPDIPGWLQFTSDQWTFITRQIEGHYPNWKQVVPDTKANTIIRIPESACQTMLDLLARIPGDYEPDYPVTLNAENRKLRLEGQNKGQDRPTIIGVDDVTVEGRPERVCLNRYYLAKALRFGCTEIHIVNELSALVMKSAHKKMVIMPLRMATTNVSDSTSEAAPEAAQESSATPPAASIATPAEPQSPAATNQAPEAPEAPTSTNDNPQSETPNTTTNTNERKRMKTATTTTETNTEAKFEAKPEAADSPIRVAMQQIEAIKDTLRSLVHQFNDVLGILKTAEKEKRATEKEVEAVREKLRQIQSVAI